jgi:hypothetical protein
MRSVALSFVLVMGLIATGACSKKQTETAQTPPTEGGPTVLISPKSNMWQEISSSRCKPFSNGSRVGSRGAAYRPQERSFR